MKRTSFRRCEQSTPNASKWLHTLLSPRECSATVQRSDWRVTPTLHPSSLWQYSLIISDPPHSGESLASWVLLCLSLSLFLFFSTGQYWQGIHFHMTTWVNVCIIHEGPSLLAGSTTQRGKKKQNGRLEIHFHSVGSVVWCYMRLNLFKYGLVCLMMSLCASPLPPLFPSVCSSTHFFVVIVTPFFLFFLYFCHHSKTATE